SLARRARMSVASRASSRKRSRSTRSSSTTDCRALRSMATLHSLSDWAALPNSSARTALSRLCSVRSSRVNRARSEAAPSKAAISKNAMTSSCRNENRCSIGQDGRRNAATSGRQGGVLHQDLAAQGALCGLGDGDVQHLAYQPRLALEVDHAVALGAAHQLGRVLTRSAFDQDALHRAQAAGADGAHAVVNRGLQVLQALELDGMRRVVGQVGGGRAGARAVDEAE